MLTSEYDFALPYDLIAQHPVEPRDASRLMIVDRRAGKISHHHFSELPTFLQSPDILVRNNSRVVPARLIGHRRSTGGKWEGLFLTSRNDGIWEVLAKTRGRPALGEFVIVDGDDGGEGLPLVLEGRGEGGSWLVRPLPERPDERDAPALFLLDRYGRPPLPPYIRRGIADRADENSYQTIFASRPGSVAAPTAGLHFTDGVFKGLAAKGVKVVDATLHVGVGTFRPIEAETVEAHRMHGEWAELTAETAATLREHRGRGGRIVALGTTSTRTLESASASGTIQAFSGPTDLFIKPGHAFQAVDALITNFHLPRSSLLVLVGAFAGLDLIRAAYAEAVDRRYRFFSYGDAMLIV